MASFASQGPQGAARARRRAALQQRKKGLVDRLKHQSWDREFLDRLLQQPHDLGQYIGRQANTRTLCSCWMCRSERKVHGNGHHALTRQELIAGLRAQDQE